MESKGNIFIIIVYLIASLAFRAGIIDQTVGLDISSYLTKEEEYYPWVKFFTIMQYLSGLLKATGKEEYKVLCHFFHLPPNMIQ